jgi:hypothetical protein
LRRKPARRNSGELDQEFGRVAQLLAKLPERRPQNTASVVASLQAIWDLVAGAREPGELPGQGKSRWPRPFRVTFLTMLTLAGLGWAIASFGPAAVRVVNQRVQALKLK